MLGFLYQTCKILKNKTRELVNEKKRKMGGGNGNETGETCRRKIEKTDSCVLSSSSTPQIGEIKQAVLDYFSETLRELIVQSLASKISENNSIASNFDAQEQLDIDDVTTVKDEPLNSHNLS